MRAASATILVLALVAPLIPLAHAATHTVTANNFAWSPQELIVAPGDSVTFVLGTGSHNWVPDFSGPSSCSLPCTVSFPDEGEFAYHCGVHPGMTGTIVVGIVPTVTITSPAAGATISGTTTVSGTASHPSAGIASVTATLNNGAPISATISGSGASVTWSAQVPTENAANGAGTIVARATTTTSFTGTSTIPVVVENTVRVDMVVASASAQQSATTSNSITFVIRNDGNIRSNVTVLAEYLYQGEWRAIGPRTITNIAVGTNAAGSISWTPGAPHVGAFTVRVTADPDGVLPDPNRANNVRTTTAGWVTSAVPGVILTDPL